MTSQQQTLSVLLAIAAAAVLAANSAADTLNVPGNYPIIQEAIDAAMEAEA